MDNPFLPLPYESHSRMLAANMLRLQAKTMQIYKPVLFTPVGRNRFDLAFEYNPDLQANVKSMGRPHFDWDRKVWSVANDQRTAFVTRFLDRDLPDPYQWWKQDDAHHPVPNITRTNLFQPQIDMINFGYSKRYVEWACEMGLGKTLAAIHLIELIHPLGDVFWVGPKSAVAAVRWEFEKWESIFRPTFLTYERMVKYMKSIQADTPAPQIVIFDESSKLKNISSQRSEAALALASAVREEWGFDGAVITMTGTPAPKSPVDWWSQIEIICPGYLKEATPKHFTNRLAVMKNEKYENGFEANKVVTWLDDEGKCAVCGQPATDLDHVIDHGFVKSKNEVAALRKRLLPITLVRYKKDCLDLPDKRYELIRLPVDPEIKRYASMLRARATSVIQAITLLRELSDGFIYEEKEDGIRECPVCHGKGKERAVKVGEAEDAEMIECPSCGGIDPDCPICEGNGFIAKQTTPQNVGEEVIRECRKCHGIGQVPRLARVAKEIRTPKDEALRALLEQNEEQGRIVVYGGFTGTIDRITRVMLSAGWDVLRIDGRGMHCFRADGQVWDYGEPLRTFQDPNSKCNLLGAVIQPESGGFGLTFTRACTAAYYSNSYKADARAQSEDRIHRIGMDYNKGATIYDFFHLPQDEAVYKVLKANRDLQDLTMREFESVVAEVKETTDSPWLLKTML